MSKIIPSLCRQNCPEPFQTVTQVLTAALTTIVLVGAILAALSLNGVHLGAISHFVVNHLGTAGGYSLFGGAALLALIHARFWIPCTPAQRTVATITASEDELERAHAIELLRSAPGYEKFCGAYKALRPHEFLYRNSGSYVLAYATEAGSEIHFFKTQEARNLRLAALSNHGYQNKDFIDPLLTNYYLKNLKQKVPVGSHHSADLMMANSKIYALYFKSEGATTTTFKWFRSREEREQFIGSLSNSSGF